MIKGTSLQKEIKHKFKQLDPSMYSLETGFADIMLILIIHGKFELANHLYLWSKDTKSLEGLLEKTLQTAALCVCNMINHGSVTKDQLRNYSEFFQDKPGVDEIFFLQRIKSKLSHLRKLLSKNHHQIEYNPKLDSRISEIELAHTDAHSEMAYLNRLVYCSDPFKQTADIIVMLFEGSPIYLKKLKDTSVKVDKIRTLGFQIIDKNKFHTRISFDVLSTLANVYMVLADDDNLSVFAKFLEQKTEELKGPVSTLLLQVKGALLQRFIDIADIETSQVLVEDLKDLVIKIAVDYFKVNKDDIPEDKIKALVYIVDEIIGSQGINKENVSDALVFINRYYFLVNDIPNAFVIACAARKLSFHNSFRDNDNWLYAIENLDEHEKEHILTTLTNYIPLDHLKKDLVKWFMQGYQIKKQDNEDDFNNYEATKNFLDSETIHYIKLNQSINKVFFTNKLYFYAHSQKIDKVTELLPSLYCANIPNTQKTDLMVEVLHLVTLNSERNLNSFVEEIESVDMGYIKGADRLIILSNFYLRLALYDLDKADYYFSKACKALGLANQKFITSELSYKPIKKSIILSNALTAAIGLEFQESRDAVEGFINFTKEYSKHLDVKESAIINYFNLAEKKEQATTPVRSDDKEPEAEIDLATQKCKEPEYHEGAEKVELDYAAQARKTHSYHQKRKELLREVSALITGNILKTKPENWQEGENIFYSTDKNVKWISHPHFKCYVTLDPDLQDDRRQSALDHGYAKNNKAAGLKCIKGVRYLKRVDKEGKDERIAVNVVLINENGIALMVLGLGKKKPTNHNGIKKLIQEKYTPETKLSLGFIPEIEESSLKLEGLGLQDPDSSYSGEESDSECELDLVATNQIGEV